MDKTNLLKLAVEIYGIEAQCMMVVEECSELIKAVCKLSRGGSIDDVLEEAADVQIMLDQIKIMFDSTNKFSGIECMKLERLENRLNKELERENNG